MDTTSIILKADTRGRVRTPRHKREQLLSEFERSGLSGAKFATLAGVSYTTFAGWVQQRRKARTGAKCKDTQAAVQQMRLVEVVPGKTAVNRVAVAQPAPPLRVLLPGGAVIEVADGERKPNWPRGCSKPLPDLRHAQLHRQFESVRGARPR